MYDTLLGMFWQIVIAGKGTCQLWKSVSKPVMVGFVWNFSQRLTIITIVVTAPTTTQTNHMNLKQKNYLICRKLFVVTFICNFLIWKQTVPWALHLLTQNRTETLIIALSSRVILDVHPLKNRHVWLIGITIMNLREKRENLKITAIDLSRTLL